MNAPWRAVEPASALDGFVGRWAALPWLVRWSLWVGTAFLVLVARRPETLLRPQFFAEDGQVFFLGTYFASPLQAALRPYDGYLHLAPRLAADAERLVPVAFAPLVGNTLALLAVALLAAFIASDRMADAIPDQRLRWTLGALLLVIPGSAETLGSTTFLQFYLAVFLLAALVATPARTLPAALAERFALAVAALSTPVTILFAPLYIARAIWRPGTSARSVGWSAAVVAAGAVVQAWFLATASDASAVVSVPPATLLELLGWRGLDVAIVGVTWAEALRAAPAPPELAVGGTLLLAGLLALAGLALSLPARLLFLCVGGTVAAAGIARSGTVLGWLWDPALLERYFLLPTACIIATTAIAVIQGSGWPRRAALVLSCLVAFAIVGDFRLPPWPNLDWPRESACIGGPTPCVVPVYPTDSWSIRWPGVAGPYVQGPVQH